jgi:alginate O-acetyltransferase complex protein AlgI
MLFNSLQYIIFLPIVIIFYYSIPPRFRWILLLSASYYFYMCWKVEYIFLIIISTLVDYYCGIQMGKREKKSKRRPFLLLSLFANLGLLFLFKYFNFFNNSIHYIFYKFNILYNIPAFEALLPVGISFYTFQTLSYSIDIYRGKQKPEKHLGIFALYVSFFPQLVAGPIERSVNLLPQFYKINKFNAERISDGLKLILWGFFKKVVIADRVAVVVNQIYNNPHNYEGIHYIVATIFFSFQIYCDFSGYSDIAIGSAKILGYDLMLNFRRPYFSKSIREFWKRWHISLSTWFKDYLYISLGGNRVKVSRWYSNLFITFLISGLWHGAKWTFVIWGALHGLYLIISIITSSFREVISKILFLNKFPALNTFKKIFITYLLTNIGWIFFRANSSEDAFFILGHLGTGLVTFFSNISNIGYIRGLFSAFGLLESEFIMAIVSIFILIGVEIVQEKYSISSLLKKKPIVLRWSFYYAISIIIMFFGVFNTSQQFIYFQF